MAIFAAVVLSHLVYLAPGGPSSRDAKAWAFMQDEGTVLYDAYRLVRGEELYRDFFEFQGPVFYWVYAPVMAVAAPTVATARAVSIAIVALGAMLLALLVSRFAGRWAGAGAALVYALGHVPFWPFAYPHWLAAAFALGGLLALTAEARTPRSDWAGGILLGLSAATIQSVGLPALVAAALTSGCDGVAARDWRAALARPARVAAGAAAVFGVIAVYFAWQGALGDLWYAVFRWPLETYGGAQGDLLYGAFTDEWVKAHRKIPQPWRLAGIANLYLTRALPVVTLTAAPIVALQALSRLWRREPDHRAALVAGASLAACTPLLWGSTRQDLTHAAFLACFGLCAAAALVAPGRRPRRFAAVAAAVPFVLAGVCVAAAYSSKVVLSWKGSRAKADWAGEVAKLPYSEWLTAVAPPGSPVVVGAPNAGYRYLYLRPSAVAHTLIPRKSKKYLTDAQWRRLADEIVARRPAALLLVGHQWAELVARRPELATLYRSAGEGRYVLAPP